MGTREERRAALIRKFKEVGAERVGRLNLGWVRLEQAPDDADTAAELLRELHTLKGESKTVGFADIALVSHKLETLVFRARDSSWRVPKTVGEVVLKTLDALDALLKRSIDDAPVDLERLLATIDGAVGGLGGEAPGDAPAPAPAAPMAPSNGSGDAAAQAPGPSGGRGREDSLRVRVVRIASISNVTGELQVEHSKVAFGVTRVMGLAQEIEERLQRLEASRTLGDDLGRLADLAKALRKDAALLEENSYRTGLHVQELDRTVRELRLVPVSTLLDLFARMVRDLAAEQGKEAVLEIDGGELEADKRILEVLEEPLLHLLRNAVDHGIEMPEVRESRGKPRHGRISIRVRHVGGAMNLWVADDGAGIDPDRLRRKVVEKGLLSAAAVGELDDQRVRELVFLPGFSTLDQATHLSGRGVGMDVVKRRVEQLGGRLTLQSQLGWGMSVDVTVPITISMTRCLILDVGRLKVAVPSASVDGIHHLVEAKVLATMEGPAMRIGDQVLPLAPLDSLLGTTAGIGAAQQGNIVVVVRSGSERIAVRVATLGREASLVVKPLGAPLNEFKLVTGAAVLESGQLVLMLDVGELVSRRRERRTPLTAQDARRDVRAAKVLVVDDSVIFQSTVSAIVSGLGHEVRVAGDGLEGVASLEAFAADLVITDIQMPRMDGLQFLKALRADARFQALPVVVLSSLGSQEDRQKAAHAGATAYLVKSQLDEQAVSEVLRRLL